MQVMDLFRSDESARDWFVSERWPEGPECHSRNIHCGIKGVPSMRLYRHLGSTQKSAWHLAQRIHKASEADHGPFAGPIEVDETYIGGKERNKHEFRKLESGRGTVDKTAVVGIKDRDTNQEVATSMGGANQAEADKLTAEAVGEGAQAYTDENAAYNRLLCRSARRLIMARASISAAWRAQRHRVVLGDAKAWSLRNVPPDKRQALGPVRERVRRAAQRPDLRHAGPDGDHR